MNLAKIGKLIKIIESNDGALCDTVMSIDGLVSDDIQATVKHIHKSPIDISPMADKIRAGFDHGIKQEIAQTLGTLNGIKDAYVEYVEEVKQNLNNNYNESFTEIADRLSSMTEQEKRLFVFKIDAKLSGKTHLKSITEFLLFSEQWMDIEEVNAQLVKKIFNKINAVYLTDDGIDFNKELSGVLEKAVANVNSGYKNLEKTDSVAVEEFVEPVPDELSELFPTPTSTLSDLNELIATLKESIFYHQDGLFSKDDMVLSRVTLLEENLNQLSVLMGKKDYNAVVTLVTLLTPWVADLFSVESIKNLLTGFKSIESGYMKMLPILTES